MPHALANGVSLYYEIDGTGERLLVISGTGGDLRRTPGLAGGPALAPFQKLQYDQRGLGQSAVPPGPYSMGGYAGDAAALLDAVGWDDCAVLGISFGGMVAQELAIRHPQRVRRLVLACTSAGGAGGSSFPLHELVGVGDDAALARHMELLDTRWDAVWRAANPDTVQMMAEGLGRLGRSDDVPGAENGVLLQLEARSRHDTSSRLGLIRCPTLVCGGRFDCLAPPAHSAFLARGIPGARLEMFDGGHIFFLQDHAALPAMADFLLG
jgi:3-oxoadipate enol-lactonase